MAYELVQILATCPTCRVEAAVLEVVELRPQDSVVIDASCRLCGREVDAGELVNPGRHFETAAQVEGALRGWAQSEGEDDLDAFVAASFGGLDRAALVAALLAGQGVETSFDVIGWLFPGMSGSAAPRSATDSPPVPASAVPSLAVPSLAVPSLAVPSLAVPAVAVPAVAVPAVAVPAVAVPAVAVPAVAVPAAQSQADGRRLALKALAAVMLADGKVRPGELAFLEGFAQRAGLQGLDPELVRPWRPQDVDLPVDPAPILLAMVDLAFIDRQRDPSEWRVVREFARHWGYPLEHLEALARDRDAQLAPAMLRLWRSLQRLLLTS